MGPARPRGAPPSSGHGSASVPWGQVSRGPTLLVSGLLIHGQRTGASTGIEHSSRKCSLKTWFHKTGGELSWCLQTLLVLPSQSASTLPWDGRCQGQAGVHTLELGSYSVYRAGEFCAVFLSSATSTCSPVGAYRNLRCPAPRPPSSPGRLWHTGDTSHCHRQHLYY